MRFGHRSMRLALVILCTLTVGSPGGKRGRTSKIGSAPALSQHDWHTWVSWVLDEHTTHMYVITLRTGMVALRCGEACALRAEDFQLDHAPPRLIVRGEPGSGKSPGAVPIMPEQAEILQGWMRNGLEVQRSQKKSQHGSVKVYMDRCVWPSSGRLFFRAGATNPRRKPSRIT